MIAGSISDNSNSNRSNNDDRSNKNNKALNPIPWLHQGRWVPMAHAHRATAVVDNTLCPSGNKSLQLLVEGVKCSKKKDVRTGPKILNSFKQCSRGLTLTGSL